MKAALAALLESRHINSQELAEKCGLSPATFSNRMNARTPWVWSEVCRFCTAMDMTFDEFFGYFPVDGAKPQKPKPKKQKPKTDLEQMAAALEAAAAMLRNKQ